MFAPDDTIVAIATPEGHGGIGVVRISGSDAPRIAHAILSTSVPLEPRRATLARVTASRSETGDPIDEVVVTWFAAPASYTGEHVVELSAHGSPAVLRAIVNAAAVAGARLARPGEFTLRAFLNGKRDLVQAEAVADLVAAATPLQARVAFDQLEGTLTQRIGAVDATLFDLIVRLEASIDFPDEGYHFVDPGEIAARTQAALDALDALLAGATCGRMIREGATVVLAGRTNVGKSSLFNALAGSERAIVTEVPGTTRDLITERVEIEGLLVTLVDTAGAREALDVVEKEGVTRGTRAREVADLVLLVLDGSDPRLDEDRMLLAETAQRPRLIVVNKCDRPAGDGGADGTPAGALRVSAATGDGLPALRCAMYRALTGGETRGEPVAVSNARHIALLRDARRSVASARDAAAAGPTPEEFLLADLQAARRAFDEIVGRRTADDVLTQVFERFCVGK